MKPSATYEPGTLLAEKFRVVRLLGTGGMGAVYEVVNERIAKRYAIKVLHADESTSPDLIKRFHLEIKADGYIRNAHIVEVHDDGVLPTGEPYVVMELLEGETLAQLIERKTKLDLPEMCELLGQACKGVQAAHNAGIIHRDLKPANLFITMRDGKPFVKLVDFGVSKFQVNAVEDMTTTREGTLLGTPFYMAPEQIQAKTDLDSRIDVYALGVILYECATGEVPYPAENLPALGLLIGEGNPKPLRDLRPDLPERFRSCIRQAMAVDRRNRFTSAEKLGEVLRSIGADVHATASDANTHIEIIVPDEQKNVDPMRKTVPDEQSHGFPRTPISNGIDAPAHQAPSAPIPRWLPPTIIAAIALGAVAMWVGFEIADRRRVPDPVITVPTATEKLPLSATSTAEKPPVTSEPIPSMAVPTGTASATAAPSSNPSASIRAKTVSTAKPEAGTDIAARIGVAQEL